MGIIVELAAQHPGLFFDRYPDPCDLVSPPVPVSAWQASAQTMYFSSEQIPFDDSHPEQSLTHGTCNTTRNSTLLTPASATYWGQYDEISKYNSHLNVAEKLWAAWYAWMQNDVLATGIMSFLMHEIVYFGRALPWIIIDSLGLFRQYKIQGVSSFSRSGSHLRLRKVRQKESSELTKRTGQSSVSARAVGLRQVRPAQPLHC